jgi:hypothetical protein
MVPQQVATDRADVTTVMIAALSPVEARDMARPHEREKLHVKQRLLLRLLKAGCSEIDEVRGLH